MRWIEYWLNSQVRRIEISHTKYRWRQVTSGVPKELILDPVLFNIFINGLCYMTEYTLSRFSGGTKLGGAPDGCASFKRVLNKLGNWEERNFRKFNKGK